MADVAVLGAGVIGSTLTRRLVDAGRAVTVGVRDIQKSATLELGAETGARIMTALEASANADVIILAIPGADVADLAPSLGAALNGKIVIDATNRFGDSGAMNGRAYIAAAAPTAIYTRAFNSVGWECFAEPEIDGIQVDLMWCGPDGEPRRIVEAVIADVGLRPIRVGDLDQLSTVDALARLWFALAIDQQLGRHLAFKVLMPTTTAS